MHNEHDEHLAQLEQELERCRADSVLLGVLLRSTADVVVTCTPDGTITGWSAAARALRGCDEEAMIGRPVNALFEAEEWSADLAHDAATPLDGGLVRHDGSTLRAGVRLLPVCDPDGGLIAYIGAPGDMSGRGLVEEQLRHWEFRDELTGLANRRRISDIAKSDPSRAGRSVVVIDLDRFNAINDTYGHDVGDEVLKVVAERLREVVMDDDWLVRLGGDQFGIFLPTADLTVPRELGERARAAICLPISIGGVAVFVDCSVGIACGGEDESVSRVMSRADACVYEVKHSGSARRVVAFDPEVHGAVMDTLALSADLRGAVQREELVLHYQPIVDMVSRQTVGFEALVRWVHPQRGVVAPLRFIPVAEQIGLMPDLGAWVLQEACRQAAVWRAQFNQVPYVSVNLSIRQLEDPDFPERFRAAVESARMMPGQLVVEVTESALATKLDVLVGPLEALRRTGARVYLDDFGTGYSSLGYVRQLPLDGVKLDRVFIQDLTTSDDAWAIARAVVALLAKLGLSLTAEGIESAAHLAQLRSLGCGQGQGYYFGRPLPASASNGPLRGTGTG